jgi:iron complex transport system substrate-binding protein
MTTPDRALARGAALAAFVLLATTLACARGEAKGATRVVSVSKQINEYLYDIHAESVLVARDLTSIYPERIRSLPSVGYHRGLSAEGIISMRPTMLLTDGNLGPDAVVAQVRKVGIPVVTLAPGQGPDSAQLLMARLGREFHHERQADSVLAEWRTAMAQALVDSTRWAAEPRPRVLVMHFGQVVNDYLGMKRGTTADQIVRWAGGVNALDSIGGMVRLTPELIARAAPDVIIATDVGFDRLGGVDRFAALPGLALTPAGKAKRIHRVDESEVMYFGPRTPASLRTITAWLHPKPAPQRPETQ